MLVPTAKRSEMSRMSATELRERFSAPEATNAPEEKPNFRKPHSSTPRKATLGSVNYFQDLVARKTPEYVGSDRVRQIILEGQDRVSAAIDKLKDLPDAHPVRQEFTPRPNKYAQACERCEIKVEEGEGILTKADDGAWIVEHKDGECPASEFPFPLGRYAVEGEDGLLKFYVTSRSGLFVQASDELHRVHPSAQAGVIEKIAANPEEAALTYGKELGVCGRCGRTLTSEWRNVGIGPVCAERGWSA